MKALTRQYTSERTGQDYGSLLWMPTTLNLTIAPNPELHVILSAFRDAEHVRAKLQPIATRNYSVYGPDAFTRLEELLAGTVKLDDMSVQLARDTKDVDGESFFEGATETDVNLREEPRP